MKLETWLTVLGLLLLALLAHERELRSAPALVADGTLPPGYAAGPWLAPAAMPTQPSITLTSVPLRLSMDLIKGL